MITVKYEETLESQDLKCPYCGDFIGDSWEFVTSEDSIEIECDCGKKFWGSEIVIRDFKGTADCGLNNREHEFEDVSSDCLKCKICGDFKLKE